MRRSLSIGGSSSVQWRKVGRSWRLRMCFRRLLCVRIEIDQLQCVNCWVIIHCLSVSCTKINHSRCALVIWSSLQLTSKQWIITQQFTVGADLFLNYNSLPKNWSEIFIFVIIDGCLATIQHGLICHTWYNKTITMAIRLSILAYCYGITWTTYLCIHIWIYWNFFQFQRVLKIIILYFKKIKTRDKQLSKFQNFHSSIWMHNINFHTILLK